MQLLPEEDCIITILAVLLYLPGVFEVYFLLFVIDQYMVTHGKLSGPLSVCGDLLLLLLQSLKRSTEADW